MRYITLHDMRGTDAKQTPYPRRFIATRWVSLSYVLNTIADALGVPIRCTRGRSGGGFCPPGHSPRRPTSQHRKARACDFTVRGIRPARVSVAIAKLLRTNPKFKRLLKGWGTYRSFTHVDVRPGKRLRRWRG